MVAANANILTEMKEKSKAEGKAEGIEIGEDKGIKKTLTVIQLSNSGKTITEIAKECELTESKVREILESVGIK